MSRAYVASTYYRFIRHFLLLLMADSICEAARLDMEQRSAGANRNQFHDALE